MSSFGRGRALVAAMAGLVALGAAAGPATASDLGFAKPQFVSDTLAGGEPLVFADRLHGTLIYSSHEGTTHLYRNGLASIPVNWLAGYRDQVNTWYSEDNGKTWKLAQLDVGGVPTGFNPRPDQNLGFSDPDLTQDAGGRVYNTGIDLANDSIFSTADGGKTWDRGTAYCHEGDRPWLAGVGKDQVFVSINDSTDGHHIFESDDGGNTCNGPPGADSSGAPTLNSAITDSGALGKLLYNPVKRELVEPFQDKGLGVATYQPGSGMAAFTKPTARAYNGSLFAHWPAMAIDKAGTLYLVWDTSPSGTHNGGQGCTDTLSGAPANTQTAPPNAIQYRASHDDGRTWGPVQTVAPPTAGHIVFWPWIAAGDDGRISVVWYETDQAVDIDCAPVSLRIKEATISAADTATPTQTTVDAAGRPIHYGTVCQGGTTCVATGEDRRLGDFFSNAVDANGCVMVASGDTTKWDSTTFTEQPYSLPIIIRQNSGPSLYTKADGSPVDCANPTG